MAAEVARNAWGIVNHHQQQGVLELRWLPSTSDMTDDDFKVTLELFAEQAERTGAPFLLIDATDFVHQFGEGVMEWRNQQIIPRHVSNRVVHRSSARARLAERRMIDLAAPPSAMS